MSIHLSKEDRLSLERFRTWPVNPTHRQKAVTLLDLDQGKSPTEAAQHAGISKEEVESLAAEFAECGLAGIGLNEEPKIRVRLVRPGIGVHQYQLSGGATVADLLHTAEVVGANHEIYVDGLIAEETVPLHDDVIVLVIARARDAAVDQPWRATIPSFRDDHLFRQYTDALKSRRQQPEPDEGEDS